MRVKTGLVLALALILSVWTLAAHADIVITEIMIDPHEVSDGYGEWFEVYNTGTEDVDMSGWTITDADGQSHTIGSLVVPAGEYGLLVETANSSWNGGVSGYDYHYSGHTFDNTADELYLRNSSDELMDAVEWDINADWYVCPGTTVILYDMDTDNNDPANWGLSTVAWPGSDEDFGSPGYENEEARDEPVVVISEIMFDPHAVSDGYGEWFELYNAEDDTINVRLYTFSDLGGQSFFIGNNLFIPPNEHVVLVETPNSDINGGVIEDYSYSSFLLDNEADEIILTGMYGNVVDEVHYDMANGFPPAEGASMTLPNLEADNNIGANWGISTVVWQGSEGDFGSPSEENEGPYVLPNIVISEIMYDPFEVIDGYGEWFEVTNLGAQAVNLRMWTFSDTSGQTFMPATDVYVEPGDYVVFAETGNSSYNGGVNDDFDYDGMYLTNEADQIIVRDMYHDVIDEVWYDEANTFPSAYGASIYLPDLEADNNVGTNWLISTLVWPGGDGDFGSPGELNQEIPAPTQVKITEIMKNPAAVIDGYGEWFELVNEGDEAINLRLWDFYDAGDDFFTVTAQLVLEPGDYAVLAETGNYSLNGHVVDDYDYNNMDLDNGDDEIIARDIHGVVQDQIYYLVDGNWPDPEGATMTLPDPRLDNQDPLNWVISEEPWGGSEGDFGSPNWPMHRGILTLTPTQTVIPAGGGNLQYGIDLVTYLYVPYENCAFWTEAVMPDSTVYPIGNQYFTLAPFLAVTMPNQVQPVPGGAPEGDYTFNAYIGYPETHIIDSFEFTKLGSTGESFGPEDWLAANPFTTPDEAAANVSTMPNDYAVGNAYPNPFNPTTSLDISLPQAGELNVSVYNVTGQLVSTVASGTFPAGRHTLTVNGSQLASGVYFVRATVPGKMTEMRKLVLMK